MSKSLFNHKIFYIAHAFIYTKKTLLMKRIYKLTLVALIAFSSTSLFAQSPIKFGIDAGVNLSNSSLDDSGVDKKAKVGFQIGVVAEYEFAPDFFLQSGLSFTTKGSKYEEKVSSHDESVTFNQMYLQLPIYAAYKLEVTPDMKIVFNAGPYMAYGIGGKTKWKNPTIGGDAVYTGTLKEDTFGDDGLKRFDFGLGGGVGAEFSQIFVGLKYELGLADISRGQASYRNRSASLTVGYRF